MEKTFLVYYKSGRPAKGRKVSRTSIEENFELDETDDNTEQTLREYLQECSVGEKWETTEMKIICI